MKFTYESYASLLRSITESGYQFTSYRDWQAAERSVILRHDVDMCLEKAVRMSEMEKELINGSVTYFILLTSDFYNVHSKRSLSCIREIIKNGGTIGLHFDEQQYEALNEKELQKSIVKELDVLSDIVGIKIDTVSMHRPSKKILSAEIQIPGVVNSYAACYFKEMKYLSDSRRRWHEDVDGIVGQKQYRHLHILTHPIWYMDGDEKSLHQTLKDTVLGASVEYWNHLNGNFRDLEAELARGGNRSHYRKISGVGV